MNGFDENRSLAEAVKREIQKQIVGQENTVELLLTVLFSGGNVLLEGMPGLGKTQLVHTISKVFDLSFKRIQFTPDLMPQDITGTSVLVRGENGSDFTFRKGPVFANVVLADEINRATPKTQSALLEAMQEQTVTEGGKTYELPSPFFVLATQNPIETEGTYPLPEAQLDRFLCKLNIEFPTDQVLKEILLLTETEKKNEAIPQKLCDAERLMEIREQIAQIKIADPVMDYLVKIVGTTHEPNKYIRVGSSPRGGQAMVRMCRARAFMQGRYNVSYEDVKCIAYPALRHRIVPSFDAIAEGITTDRIIDMIIESHPE